ncbi:hypothetical protein ACOMHN_001887 [Nucella lapillus]
MLRHPEEHHLRPERIQEFYGNVRRYFETTCAYLLKKLPLRDPLLQHARLVDPAKQLTATQEDLHYFLERFPPLLPAGASVETIEEQFSTYQVTTITDCIGDTVDKTWVAITKAHPDLKPLCEVMLGICTIPHSSAACERVFSCVRKTCTDQRASLGQDTVEALLVQCVVCCCCYSSVWCVVVVTAALCVVASEPVLAVLEDLKSLVPALLDDSPEEDEDMMMRTVRGCDEDRGAVMTVMMRTVKGCDDSDDEDSEGL